MTVRTDQTAPQAVAVDIKLGHKCIAVPGVWNAAQVAIRVPDHEGVSGSVQRQCGRLVLAFARECTGPGERAIRLEACDEGRNGSVWDAWFTVAADRNHTLIRIDGDGGGFIEGFGQPRDDPRTGPTERPGDAIKWS